MSKASELIWLDGRPVGRRLVGGKGASRSKLASLGAPVPPGFALTTAAYETASRSIGIPSRANCVSDEELPAIRKAMMIIPGVDGQGTKEVALPRSLRSMAILRGDQIAAISSTAHDLSRKLNFPADLEGGIAGDQVYYFRARSSKTLTAMRSQFSS